jgi:DNA-directed RNA polymerase subunit RPC12/RpoP
MADPVPGGSDPSAGTYRCTNCSNELQRSSTTHLPPCPSCGNGEYRTIMAMQQNDEAGNAGNGNSQAAIGHLLM